MVFPRKIPAFVILKSETFNSLIKLETTFKLVGFEKKVSIALTCVSPILSSSKRLFRIFVLFSLLSYLILFFSKLYYYFIKF